MRQKVLSIDTTINPTQALLVEVEGASFRIIERHSLGIGLNELHQFVENLKTAPSKQLENNPFLQLILNIEHTWDFACLLLTPPDLITANLALPFDTDAKIAQIIPGEIQDQIALDIEDYHLQYDIRGSFEPELTEVRVQLVKKGLIDDLLYLCQKAGVEPSLITTPGTILPLVLHLTHHAAQMTAPHAIVYSCKEWTVVTIYAHGNYRSEHLLLPEHCLPDITSEVKRCLAWAEDRYNVTLDPLFFIGEPHEREMFERAVGRKCAFAILPPQTPRTHALATLAAMATQEERPFSPFGNFRSGEYGYNPYVTYTVDRLKALFPIAVVFTLLLSVGLFGMYTFRNYEIRKYRLAVREKIISSVEDLDAPRGAELPALRGRIRQLEEQVAALGSVGETSPLSIVGIIAKYFPNERDIQLSLMSLQDNKVRLRGQAPDHSTVEKVRRALRKRKQYFCKIKKQSTSRSGDRDITFEYTLEMCQR